MKVSCPRLSLNDSLDGEIQAFLTDEDQLHTYDDLTKVNPVTPTTGVPWSPVEVSHILSAFSAMVDCSSCFVLLAHVMGRIKQVLMIYIVFLTVLKCLQARYSAKVFYTHAGCTLVALNPFQPIPGLYSLDVMKEYHYASQPQVLANISLLAKH